MDFRKDLCKEQQRYVYHAELYIGGQRTMMANNLLASPALSLTVAMDTKEKAMVAFEVLRDGGEIIFPPHSTTYSSCTANALGRFVSWWTIMT